MKCVWVPNGLPIGPTTQKPTCLIKRIAHFLKGSKTSLWPTVHHNKVSSIYYASSINMSLYCTYQDTLIYCLHTHFYLENSLSSRTYSYLGIGRAFLGKLQRLVNLTCMQVLSSLIRSRTSYIFSINEKTASATHCFIPGTIWRRLQGRCKNPLFQRQNEKSLTQIPSPNHLRCEPTPCRVGEHILIWSLTDLQLQRWNNWQII